jgi:hypothetical protein
VHPFTPPILADLDAAERRRQAELARLVTMTEKARTVRSRRRLVPATVLSLLTRRREPRSTRRPTDTTTIITTGTG